MKAPNNRVSLVLSGGLGLGAYQQDLRSFAINDAGRWASGAAELNAALERIVRDHELPPLTVIRRLVG
jgi:hypothetical protein